MTQEKRKEMTKTSIEQAGIKCLSIAAFDKVTMEEIAKEAGFTKRTVYKYFPSKAALIASIFERKLEELYTLEATALMKCQSAKEVITVHFTTLNQFTNDNLGFMQMFWALKDNINNGEVPDEVLVKIIAWNRMLIDMPASTLGEKGLTGFLSGYSPYTVIHYISAINKGLYMQYDKENKLSLMDAGISDLRSFVLENLLHSL